ncbi:four helix bundle protein [Robiginitalea marina]
MIIEYTEHLRRKDHREMASQLFRSGTGIGANVCEAQNAESPADFVHKFKIAAKEAEETEYWLRLCLESGHYPKPEEGINSEIRQICRLINRIIGSSKRRMHFKNNHNRD